MTKTRTHSPSPACRWIALLLLVWAWSGAALAFSNTRNEEIAECRAGEIQTWKDGVDRPAIAPSLRLNYRHAHAPEWFTAAQVEALVSKAALAWAPCGVPVSVVPVSEFDPGAAGSVIVLWGSSGNRNHFGLANLDTRTLTLEPAAFAMLREKNPRHDATQTLQLVISHEMGHFFGLMAHSRRCVDVLSYYHDGKGSKCYTRDGADIAGRGEYRHIMPTACDIARCRAANGLLPAQTPSPNPLRPAPPTARRPY